MNCGASIFSMIPLLIVRCEKFFDSAMFPNAAMFVFLSDKNSDKKSNMFFEIIKYVHSTDLFDGSDLYRLFSTCNSMRKHFSWLKIEKTLSFILGKYVKKNLDLSQLLAYWYAVHSISMTENMNDACTDYPGSFITSWYLMRLVLLSSYLLHKRKICYYCHRTSKSKIKNHNHLEFHQTWKFTKDLPRTDITYFGYFDSKCKLRVGQVPSKHCFTICEECQHSKKFCSINSFCRENGLKYKKILSLVPENCILYLNTGIYKRLSDEPTGTKFAPIKTLLRLQDTVGPAGRFHRQFIL